MNIFLRYLAIVALAILAMTSCSSFDDEHTPLNEPSVEEVEGGAFYSIFYIPTVWFSEEESNIGDIIDIKLEFLPLSNRIEPYRYDATMEIGKSHTIRFLINSDSAEDLPSGEYLLRGYDTNRNKFTPEFHAVIKNRIVTHISNIPDYSATFDLGDGTSENPYIIASKNIFLAMCTLISEDATYGAGKYFKQICDLDLPSNMGMLTEEGWYNVNFAGNYNGMNNTIYGFSFNGIRDDNAYDIGLFRTLHNGAVIENLKLNASGIHGVAERGGILAGSVADGATVTIRNTKLSGSIWDSGGSIGGLIGYMNNATITIEDVDMGMNITCTSQNKDDKDNGYRIGGLIGFAINSNITIRGGEIYLDNLYIEGGSCVGAIIGETRECNISISEVELEHTTSKDLQTLVGKEHVGGAIGYLDVKGNCDFNNVTIAFPISGVNNVGGVVGTVNNKQDFNCKFELELRDTYVSSNLIGSQNVGGYVGSVKNSINSSDSSLSSLSTISFKNNCYFGSIEGNKTVIRGDKNVGGLIGYVDPNTLYNFTSSNTVVAAEIIATESSAGGLIGHAEDIYMYLYNPITLPSTKIIAPKYVGGVVGYMNGGQLQAAGNRWDFLEKGFNYIPTHEQLIDDDNEYYSAIKVECDSSSQYVGGVVGYAASNSKVFGFHTSSEVTGGKYVGGIVGGAVGSNITISMNYPRGFIRGFGIEIGGIVGRAEGDVEIKNSINYARIEDGGSGAEIGGIVGYAKNTGSGMPHIHYCVNVAPIVGCNVAAGVVGLTYVNMEDYHEIVMIENCANYGNITGNSNSNYSGASSGFGGILGHSSNTPGMQLAHCANHGDLNINCSVHGVGGIVGAIGNDPVGANEEKNYHIWECANHGNIYSNIGSFHVGGIAGYMEEGTITKGNHACVEGCYNWGDIDVPVDGNHGLGGIAGYLDHYAELWHNINFKILSGYDGSSNTGRVWGDHKGSYTSEHCYYAVDGSTKGHAFNINDMGDATTFSELNINVDGSFWVISSGDSHPQIRNCPFQNTTYQE